MDRDRLLALCRELQRAYWEASERHCSDPVKCMFGGGASKVDEEVGPYVQRFAELLGEPIEDYTVDSEGCQVVLPQKVVIVDVLNREVHVYRT